MPIENGELVLNGVVTAENKRRDITALECLDLHFEWRLELASFATIRVATPYIEPAIRDWRVRRLDVLRMFPAAENSEHTGAAGRPPAADWPALEEALEREIDLVGFPNRSGAPGWRTNADVGRWIEERTGDAEPGKTSLKTNVKKMLKGIRSRKGGN